MELSVISVDKNQLRYYTKPWVEEQKLFHWAGTISVQLVGLMLSILWTTICWGTGSAVTSIAQEKKILESCVPVWRYQISWLTSWYISHTYRPSLYMWRLQPLQLKAPTTFLTGRSWRSLGSTKFVSSFVQFLFWHLLLGCFLFLVLHYWFELLKKKG